MKISLLIIASEILEGKVQDLNTLNFSKFLKLNHLTLQQVLTVADNQESIAEGLDFLKESDLVVISGGLGPTPDDLTKSTLASYFNCSLLTSVSSLAVAQQNYQQRGRVLPENHPYQFIPSKALPLLNSEGYAPGLLFKENNQTVIALPGVPKEFKAMIEMHLPPLLRNEEQLFDFIIRTHGMGEEAIFNQLDPKLWQQLSTFGAVASLPSLLAVDITVRLTATSVAAMESKKEKLLQFITSHPLQEYIWHIGEKSLEAVIIEKARLLGVRFGFAESCSGGLCSDKMTNVDGSSSAFYGSVVCYHSQIKTQLLKVDPALIDQFNVVSAPVSEKMAQGLRSLFPIDIAVSLTGHAGPHPLQQQIPTGTVYVASSSELGTWSTHHHFTGNRQHLKQAFAQVALFQLLKTLEKLARR